jgi:protoheme IX farnesyltransferase
LLTTIKNYIEVLKPRETLLLGFIGVCAVIVGSGGNPPVGTLLLATTAILIASGAANGLTNYLDRNVDALMGRTANRVFPTHRIYPARKALPWLLFLVITGLVLAWFLHPLAFVADLVGTVAAVVFRKRVICVFPQGVIAGCAPVLMGWFAVNNSFNWEIALICLLITAWLPLHVWSVMVSNRDQYLGAGLKFFPMNVSVKSAVVVLLFFAVALNAAGIGLYFMAGYGWLYLVTVVILGAMMLFSSTRLVTTYSSRSAWRLYKLSSFPYLGILFLAMCLDIWLR